MPRSADRPAVAGRAASPLGQSAGLAAPLLAIPFGSPSRPAGAMSGATLVRDVLALPPLAAGVAFPRPNAGDESLGGGSESGSASAEAAAWLVGLAETSAAGSSAASLRLPTPPRRESLALASASRSLTEPTYHAAGARAASVEPAQHRASVGPSGQASLDQMARQVYAIIRQRLAVERERGGLRGARAW